MQIFKIFILSLSMILANTALATIEKVKIEASSAKAINPPYKCAYPKGEEGAGQEYEVLNNRYPGFLYTSSEDGLKFPVLYVDDNCKKTKTNDYIICEKAILGSKSFEDGQQQDDYYDCILPSNFYNMNISGNLNINILSFIRPAFDIVIEYPKQQ